MKEKIRFVYLIILVLVINVYADIPDGYYDDAQGLTGAELKSALHTIIKTGHVKFPYNSSSTDVWDLLMETDEDPENSDNVILLYTGRSQPKTTNGGNVDDWNREHVWAKSHGFPDESDYGYTDIHHLRPTDVSVNSSRSSLDFDEGGTQHSEATECFYDNDSWEPRDAVKGDVARMMFYMATRYEGDGGSGDDYDLELVDYTGTPANGPEFGKLSTLIAWHNLDPVDDFEKNRNDIIYSWQKNRNPFIDHPEYISSIWGGEVKPTVAFESTSAIIEESTGIYQVALSLNSPHTSDIIATLEFAGTASSEDYTATTTVTFPAESTENQFLAINITDDTLPEDSETIEISITELNTENAQIGLNNKFTLTIDKNDGFDNTSPTITNITAKNRAILEISFSEEIEKTSAEILTNFSVDNGIGNPLVALKSKDNPQKVILAFDLFEANTDYILTVNNVKDLAGNIIAANSNVDFSYKTGDGSPHFTESFENGSSFTSYYTGTITYDSGDWDLNSVYLETSSSNAYDGSKALRLNDDTANSSLTSPQVNSVGTVTFYYRPLSSTNTCTFHLQKSVNGGVFTNIKSQTYDIDSFQEFTANVNDASENIRIRILNDNQKDHLIVDQITITSLAVEEGLKADLSCDDQAPEHSCEVQFLDYSEGSVANWEWDFDNDGIVDSNERHPVYNYPESGTYSVKLTVSDDQGNSDTIIKDNFITISSSSVAEENFIKEFTLQQNYPNPFNPVTTINFNLIKNSDVKLTIFNTSGQIVKEFTSSNLNKGNHTVRFNAEKLNSGIYFYKLDCENQSVTKKMTLLK